jgi:hypothetical protein
VRAAAVCLAQVVSSQSVFVERQHAASGKASAQLVLSHLQRLAANAVQDGQEPGLRYGNTARPVTSQNFPR